MFQRLFDRLRLSFPFLFSHQPLMIVGAIMMLGAFLRIYHLGFKSLWLDEAALYWISHGSLDEIIAQNVAGNSAPPLFALLLNLVSRTGESEAALRSLSCFAGIAAIPAMYFLSKQFVSRNATYVCTFIVAIAPSQVQYSQQLREYSITFLLAILMLAFFYRYLCKQRWSDLVLLTVTCILSIFTQYGLALLIFALNLTLIVELVFRAKRRTLVVRWVVAQLLVLGAVAAVYQLSLKHQMRPGGFAAGGTSNYLAGAYWLDRSLRSLARLAVVGTYGIFSFSYPATFLLFFTFCLGFLAALRERKGRTAIMMFALPVISTFTAASARLYPYHGGRQDIFLTVMIYILVGYGVEHLLDLDRKLIVSLTLIFVLGLSGFAFTFRYLNSTGPENIRPIVSILSFSFEPGDRIYVYYGASPAFRYYYRSNVDRWIDGVSSRGQPDEYCRQLDEVLSQQGRVWMVFSHCHADECELIPEYASQLRRVEEISADDGAALYLAH